MLLITRDRLILVSGIKTLQKSHPHVLSDGFELRGLNVLAALFEPNRPRLLASGSVGLTKGNLRRRPCLGNPSAAAKNASNCSCLMYCGHELGFLRSPPA